MIILEKAAALSQGRPAHAGFNYYTDRWRDVTYAEFLKTVESLTSHLIEAGLRKGDRAAIVSENRYEWCAAYLSVLAAGGVTVPVDANCGIDEIKNIFSDSESKAAFASSSTLNAVKEASAGLDIRLVNFDSPEFKEIKEILKAGKKTGLPSPGEDDTASLVYTSGTTGRPKAVMLTHKNLVSDMEAVIAAGIMTIEDNVLSMLPLHHTYALMCTFLAPLFAGGRITYPPTLKGPELIKAIKDKGVTILIGVPRIIESVRNSLIKKIGGLPFPLGQAMLKAVGVSASLRRRWDINAGRVIFSSVHKAFGRQLRFITSGGARLEPEIMNDMEALGFTVLEGYGLTETSPVVTFSPPERRKPGSAGRPLKGVEIRILNPSQEGQGEVAIKGPMVMKGYYRNPEATRDVLKDGWFLSGDLGRLDSEGYLFLTGRAKDVIVLSSGKNIYPEDVEREYGRIPLIKEICVMARRDRLEAVIVPDMEYLKRERIGNVAEALRWEINAVSQRLSPHMRLMGYAIHPEPLPKTPIGKLRRFLIKDLAEASPPLPEKEDMALTGDETGGRVIKCLSPLMDEPRMIQSKDNLELDIGLDSLKRIELIVALEKEFSVKLPESLVSEVQTVGELVQKIKEALSFKEEAVLPPKGKEMSGIKPFALEGPLRFFFRSLLRIFFKLFFSLEVKGAENLPSHPFIIAANHSSYLDGFALASGMPYRVFRSLYFQGFQRYFRGRFTSLFARLAHVILIDPDAYLGKALQLSAHAVREGKSLAIFPEGGRSFDGSIMPFKKGIGMLAVKLDVPVVPVKIEGTYEILPRGARWFRAGKIRLTFGRALRASELDFSKMPGGVDEHQHFADILRKRIEEIKKTVSSVKETVSP